MNKESHWIDGFHAAIIQDGELMVAPDWDDYHGEVGRGAYARSGDYRGLYNPQEQILLHLLGPGDEDRAGEVNDVPEEHQLEYIGNHKAVWMAAAEKAGIPVKEYGQGYLKDGQDAWDTIADGTAHWMKKDSHWIPGFYAAVISETPDGIPRMYYTNNFDDTHYYVPLHGGRRTHRGLYDPKTKTLVHLTSTYGNERNNFGDFATRSQLPEYDNHKEEWLEAARNTGVEILDYGVGYVDDEIEKWRALGDSSAKWERREAHWIPGFHAAIYDPNTGLVYVGDSDRDSHGDTGADEDAYLEQYRGLYNPNSFILLHVTAGEEEYDAIDGSSEVPSEYQAKEWGAKAQADWLKGAEASNLPVYEYGYAYEYEGAYASPWQQNLNGTVGRGVGYKIIWKKPSKTTHWIPGFYAALMSADAEGWPLQEDDIEWEWGEEDEFGDQELIGPIKETVEFIVATDPTKTHTETLLEKTGLDENDIWDIMEYEAWRGLYNPTTGTLLHMTEPGEVRERSDRLQGRGDYYENYDEEPSGEPIDSFLSNDVFAEAWLPEEVLVGNPPTGRLKQLWTEAATREGYQVNEFGVAYFDPEYIAMQEIPKWRQEHGLLYKITKTSHWIPGFIAAVIGQDGYLYIGDNQYDNHGLPSESERTLEDKYIPGTHRGLYDPKSQTLLHITTKEEYYEVGEMPTKEEADALPDHSQEWREAALISGIPVKHYGYAHEAEGERASPWARWDERFMGDQPDPRQELVYNRDKRKDVGWGTGATWTITHHPNLKAHVSGWIKEGTKLDWLKSRPDKALATPEGQALLKYFGNLVASDPNIDVILPWLVREWKKGRLKLKTYTRPLPGAGFESPKEEISVLGFKANQNDFPDEWSEIGDDDDDTWQRDINPDADHLASFAEWVKESKGVDIMRYTWGEAATARYYWYEENIGKRREKDPGTIIYQFPDGWTIRSISTIEQCKLEGHSMKNCIKDYQPDETTLYSLRDPKNEPHVSIEMDGNSVIQMYGKTNSEPYAYADYMRRWFTDPTQWPEGVYYMDESDGQEIYYLEDVPSFEGSGVEVNEYGIKSWNPDAVYIHYDDLIEQALKAEYYNQYNWEEHIEDAFKWARYQDVLFQVASFLQDANDGVMEQVAEDFDMWIINNNIAFQDETLTLVPDTDEWYAGEDAWREKMEEQFYAEHELGNRMTTLWEIYNKVAGQRMAKTAHWIPGYHGIMISPEYNTVYLAKTEDAFHPAFDMPDKEFDTAFRGLYNPETGDLLHMTTMKQFNDVNNFGSQVKPDGSKYYPEMLYDEMFGRFDPEEPKLYKQIWTEVMESNGYPVNSFGIYTFDPEKAIGTYNESMGAWNRAKGAEPEGYSIHRVSHWVPGFKACTIDARGEFKLARGYKSSHGELAGWGIGSEGLRGLYNPDTQTLLHMSNPRQFFEASGGLEIPYKSLITTGVWDARADMEEWITTAAEYGYNVKAYGYAYEDHPESSDPWSVQMGGGLGTAKYEILWEGDGFNYAGLGPDEDFEEKASKMRKEAEISPRAQNFINEYINAFADPMTERETYDMLFKYNTDSLRDPVDRNLLHFFFLEVAEASSDDTVKHELNEAARMLKEMPTEQSPEELSGSDRAWMNEIGIKWQ